MITLYKSDNGEIYETEGQAILADAIHFSGVYVERYKVKDIVEILDKRFVFITNVSAVTKDTPQVNTDLIQPLSIYKELR